MKVTLALVLPNVVLEKSFVHLITNDGVTIAKEIELEDHLKIWVPNYVRSISGLINDIAGDVQRFRNGFDLAIAREGIKNVTAGAQPNWHPSIETLLQQQL